MKVVFELVVEDAQMTAALAKQKQLIKEAFAEISKGVGAERYRELSETIATAKIEVGKLTDEQKRLRKEFAATQVPTDSLAGLRLEYSRLAEQIAKLSRADRESQFGKSLIKNAAEAKKQINGIEESIGRFTGSVGNYRKAFTSIFDIAGGVLLGQSIGGVVQGITDVLNKGVQGIADYGAALSRLSAITGVTGQQLELFKAQAEALTTINVNGKEIVNTSTEILNAFTLVGSARPELLKDADALAEVTKQAIVLSKASGDDLNTSVRAITASLAQFQLEATDSTEVINLLAAGSKAGKVEIPGLADSITRLGPTAKNSNVSLGETVALFETLADSGLEGERAAVQLRNIFIKLASAEVLPKKAQKAFKEFGVDAKVLADNTLPLEVRLQELSKVAGDTAALFEIFGSENIDAASILADSVPKYVELTAAVTGTNEAYKQAEINSDNLKTRFANLEKQGLNLLVQAMQGALPLLETLGETLGALFDLLAAAPEFWEENATGVTALGFAVLSLNKNVLLLTTAQGRAAIATALSTTATDSAIVATRALSAAQAAMPLLAIIAGIYLVVKAFQFYQDSASAAEKATRAVADAQADIAKESAKEAEAVRKNIEILKFDTEDKAARKKAIQDLTAAYPEYLRGIDLETASVEELTRLQNQLTDSIIRSVAERKKATALEEISSKIIEKTLQIKRVERGDTTFSEKLFTKEGLLTKTRTELAVLNLELETTSAAFDEAFSIGDGKNPAVKKAAQEAAAFQGFLQDVSIVKFEEDKKQVESEKDKQARLKKEREKGGEKPKGSAKGAGGVSGAGAGRTVSDTSAADAEKDFAAQLARINELRKAIRELDAQSIPNQFDQKELELQSRRLDALAALEEKRLKLADKVKAQKGGATEADRTEGALLSEQTASTVADFDRQADELRKARQEATDRQLEDTRRLLAETETLSRQNADRLLEIEVEGIQERAAAAQAQNAQTLNVKRLALTKDLEAGAITRKEFQRAERDAQEAFAAEALRIEKEQAAAALALAATVRDARVKAAQEARAAELQVIDSTAKSDVADIKAKGVETGADTTDEAAARELLAVEQRIAAQRAFADAVAEANQEATRTELEGIAAVTEADLAQHEGKLARIEEEKQKRKELQDFLLEQAGVVANAFFEIQKAGAEKEKDEKLTALDAEYEKKKEAAQGNKDLLAKLDAEQAKKKTEIEREAARQRKSIAIKEAIVQGALAVVKALPNPFLAIAAAIAAAAQIAIISAQKFATGGTVKRLGPGIVRERPNAPRTPQGDNVLAYLQVEEMVLTKRQQAKIRERAGADIFRWAGVPGDARPVTERLVPRFAGGGTVPDFTPQIALPNTAGQTVIVQTVAELSDEQMDLFARRVAAQTGAATKDGVGQGLGDNNRLQEREAALTRNREA